MNFASPDAQDLGIDVAQVDEILELLDFDQFDVNTSSTNSSPSEFNTTYNNAYNGPTASWTSSTPSTIPSLFESPQSTVLDSFLVPDMLDMFGIPYDVQAISPDNLLSPIGLPPLDMDLTFDNHLTFESSSTNMAPSAPELPNPGRGTSSPSSSQHPHPHHPTPTDTDAASALSLRCPECGTTHANKTKLSIHINTKHTKPFRCAAAGCAYATGEKKSWQRHLVAKAKWDEAHRVVADREGLVAAQYQCGTPGCTYVTLRGDNFKRHVRKCGGGGGGSGA